MSSYVRVDDGVGDETGGVLGAEMEIEEGNEGELQRQQLMRRGDDGSPNSQPQTSLRERLNPWLALMGASLALVLVIVVVATQPDVSNGKQGGGAGGGGSPEPAPGVDAFTAVDNAMKAYYTRAKADAVLQVKPLIVAANGSLHLLPQGSATAPGAILSEAHIPQIYTDLKVVSHIPLGLYALLRYHTDMALPAQQRQDLVAFQATVKKARSTLDQHGFSATQLARQNRIFDTSETFMDKTVQDGRVSLADLSAYTHAVAADSLANANDAAAAQLQRIHNITTKWEKSYAPAVWNQLKVLVTGLHMPRAENLVMQYFNDYLHTNASTPGERLIYATNLFQFSEVFDLLATHLVDFGVGANFFNSAQRMHRDLLSDGAAAYLAKVKHEWFNSTSVATPTTPHDPVHMLAHHTADHSVLLAACPHAKSKHVLHGFFGSDYN